VPPRPPPGCVSTASAPKRSTAPCPQHARREVLRRFERRETLATAAPLVLDEGVDVPEANLALILAASKTRRQMIQRLGRVVRRKPDGGHAHLALVVARGTSEDPACGAHLGFINEMLDVADELRLFEPAHQPELARFLTGGTGGTPFTPPPPRDPVPAPTPAAARCTQATASPDLRALLTQARQGLEESNVALVSLGARTAVAAPTSTSNPTPSPPGEPGFAPPPPAPVPPETIEAPLVATGVHPLVAAWERHVGRRLQPGEQAALEHGLRFVMPQMTDPLEAGRFVAQNVYALRRMTRERDPSDPWQR
jgi:hypothetical protein